MAKKKTEPRELKPLLIVSASLNDGLCNYSYDIQTGVGTGNNHKVKGKGIVKDDLSFAFFPLNTHMAIIDDVFKHSNIEVDNIKGFYNHDLSAKYTVSGFDISGEEGSEQVVLTGTKIVSCSGATISIKTPKIPLDSTSSYPFHKELKTAVEKARLEVELYHEGKYTEVEATPQTDPNQLNIGNAIDEQEFDQAKV